MITQLSHQLVDCPICGRPVEIQLEYFSHKLACGHCRGQFVVHDGEDCELTASAINGMDVLERAERLVQRAGASDCEVSDQCNHLLQRLSVLNNDGRQDKRTDSSPCVDEFEAVQKPTALLVEHRDEVFARIATDMAKAGFLAVRAKSATEALRLCGAYEPVLVVANIDLPDQTGWLLAGKLQFIDPEIRIWLYQPRSSSYDGGMARCLQVDHLFDYGGDLLGLSKTISCMLADLRESIRLTHDA